MLGWVLAALAGASQAQVVESDGVDPRLIACLHKGGPAIDYPAHDRQLQSPGFLRLSLKFTAPDRPPETVVLFRAASDAMLEEVRWHVRGYRLPCLPAGETVTAVQEFEFKPRETAPVTWTSPRAVSAKQDEGARPARPDACMRTPKTPPDLWGPVFQRDVVNIFVKMSFTAPDAAPDVEVLYSSASPSQVQSVTDYARQYRVPCLAPGGKPYVVQQQFTYRPYGAAARVFKDAVKLTAFLSNMKDIQQARANFDFGTMNCPFQVAWTLGKPAVDNSVGEVGPPDLNRAEFLAWLASLQMDLEPKAFQQMVGQTVFVNVPCGSLTLGPKP
jgi:hypothetical protein